MNKSGILMASLLGLFGGLGSFTFYYGEGFSYFSKDPAACMNCHIMTQQFNSWQKASHHTAATCVDCHLPHSFIYKYISKAENGWNHSKAFTLENFHEPIMVTPKNKKILQENCIKCHQHMVENLVHGSMSSPDAVDCIHCHRSVGHGETAGLGGPSKLVK
jgi:cytochrome c nitrite reductase small subunit|tara:strand:+ start:419 stop:901 length:483 start_codon:yes stop_codon:yes gene_type:complete